MTRIGNLIRDPEELRRRAQGLQALSTVLDRVTKKDLDDTAQALRDCATDIAYLLRGEQIGCSCRRIDNENNGSSYLIYEDSCPHHKHMKATEERLKTDYARAEAQLKQTVRYDLAKAALSSVNMEMPARSVSKRAFEIADAMIAELTK